MFDISTKCLLSNWLGNPCNVNNLLSLAIKSPFTCGQPENEVNWLSLIIKLLTDRGKFLKSLKPFPGTTKLPSTIPNLTESLPNSAWDAYPEDAPFTNEPRNRNSEKSDKKAKDR